MTKTFQHIAVAALCGLLLASVAYGAHRVAGYGRRPQPHPQGLQVIDQDYQDRNPDNGVSDGGFPETN